MKRLVAVLCLAVLSAGCASLTNTLAQDLAWERWQKCSAEVPGYRLQEIRPDGQTWYYAYMHDVGAQAMNACLDKAAAEQAQRRLAAK